MEFDLTLLLLEIYKRRKFTGYISPIANGNPTKIFVWFLDWKYIRHLDSKLSQKMRFYVISLDFAEVFML